ncbi:hypothetical protein [Thalassotalea sp. PP2-459]|uniref:hypothetical protein n=1 Tax=Thalassotalea sp. PP2-459 TaxID=1742724 RepID=UPI00111534FB|nr:hypothetical protein [Thalassotalea sp. PP2-459]
MRNLLLTLFYRTQLPVSMLSLATPFQKVVKNNDNFRRKLLLQLSLLNQMNEPVEEHIQQDNASITMTKRYIQREDDTWINFPIDPIIDYDKLRLIHQIKKHLTVLNIQRYISAKSHCYVDCFLNEQIMLVTQSNNDTSAKNNAPLSLKRLLKKRRFYINQLTNEISTLLTFSNKATAQHTNTIVVLLFDHSANEYMQQTLQPITTNYQTFVTQALIHLEEQLKALNNNMAITHHDHITFNQIKQCLINALAGKK